MAFNSSVIHGSPHVDFGDTVRSVPDFDTPPTPVASGRVKSGTGVSFDETLSSIHYADAAPMTSAAALSASTRRVNVINPHPSDSNQEAGHGVSDLGEDVDPSFLPEPHSILRGGNSSSTASGGTRVQRLSAKYFGNDGIGGGSVSGNSVSRGHGGGTMSVSSKTSRFEQKPEDREEWIAGYDLPTPVVGERVITALRIIPDVAERSSTTSSVTGGGSAAAGSSGANHHTLGEGAGMNPLLFSYTRQREKDVVAVARVLNEQAVQLQRTPYGSGGLVPDDRTSKTRFVTHGFSAASRPTQVLSAMIPAVVSVVSGHSASIVVSRGEGVDKTHSLFDSESRSNLALTCIDNLLSEANKKNYHVLLSCAAIDEYSQVVDLLAPGNENSSRPMYAPLTCELSGSGQGDLFPALTQANVTVGRRAAEVLRSSSSELLRLQNHCTVGRSAHLFAVATVIKPSVHHTNRAAVISGFKAEAIAHLNLVDLMTSRAVTTDLVLPPSVLSSGAVTKRQGAVAGKEQDLFLNRKLLPLLCFGVGFSSRCFCLATCTTSCSSDDADLVESLCELRKQVLFPGSTQLLEGDHVVEKLFGEVAKLRAKVNLRGWGFAEQAAHEELAQNFEYARSEISKLQQLLAERLPLVVETNQFDQHTVALLNSRAELVRQMEVELTDRQRKLNEQRDFLLSLPVSHMSAREEQFHQAMAQAQTHGPLTGGHQTRPGDSPGALTLEQSLRGFGSEISPLGMSAAPGSGGGRARPTGQGQAGNTSNNGPKALDVSARLQLLEKTVVALKDENTRLRALFARDMAVLKSELKSAQQVPKTVNSSVCSAFQPSIQGFLDDVLLVNEDIETSGRDHLDKVNSLIEELNANLKSTALLMIDPTDEGNNRAAVDSCRIVYKAALGCLRRQLGIPIAPPDAQVTDLEKYFEEVVFQRYACKAERHRLRGVAEALLLHIARLERALNEMSSEVDQYNEKFLSGNLVGSSGGGQQALSPTQELIAAEMANAPGAPVFRQVKDHRLGGSGAVSRATSAKQSFKHVSAVPLLATMERTRGIIETLELAARGVFGTTGKSDSIDVEKLLLERYEDAAAAESGGLHGEGATSVSPERMAIEAANAAGPKDPLASSSGGGANQPVVIDVTLETLLHSHIMYGKKNADGRGAGANGLQGYFSRTRAGTQAATARGGAATPGKIRAPSGSRTSGRQRTLTPKRRVPGDGGGTSSGGEWSTASSNTKYWNSSSGTESQ